MTYQGEQIESIEHRSALSTEIRNAHRSAALHRLQESGVRFVEWDPEYLASVALNHAGFVALNIVDFDMNRTELTSPLLGSRTIEVRSITTPNDFVRSDYDKNGSDPDYSFSLAQSVAFVESPAKLLTVRLLYEDNAISMENGIIMSAPGKRPFAFRELNLKTIAARKAKLTSDLSLIPDIQKIFGSKAIEFLPEDTCEALALAIRRSNPHIPAWKVD